MFFLYYFLNLQDKRESLNESNIFTLLVFITYNFYFVLDHISTFYLQGLSIKHNFKTLITVRQKPMRPFVWLTAAVNVI